MHIRQDPAGGTSGLSFDPLDARTRIQEAETKRDRERELLARFGPQALQPAGGETSNKEVMGFVTAAFAIVVVFSLGIVYIAVTVANRYGQ